MMTNQTKRKLLFGAFLLSISTFAFGQNAVGIGTETPNANAVLHLVSPTDDQGFLVPQLTTAQRTAVAFTSRMTGVENGLLVFDTDLNIFFFWEESQWVTLGLVQDLQLTANSLQITGNTSATTIDLTPYLDNTDNQDASQVPVTATGNLTATDVQAALVGFQAALDATGGDMTKLVYDANDDGVVDQAENTMTAAGLTGVNTDDLDENVIIDMADSASGIIGLNLIEGQILKQEQLEKGRHQQHTIDIKEMKDGLYILRFYDRARSNRYLQTRKMIIRHG